MLQHAVISRGVLQHALWPRQGDNPPWEPSVAQWQVERDRTLQAEARYAELYAAAEQALTLLRAGVRGEGRSENGDNIGWAVEQAIMNLEAAGVVPASDDESTTD